MDTALLLAPRKNVKLGIDFEDYCREAQRLRTDVPTIRAVDAIESAGSGFLPSRRVKILFEGHLFYNLAKRHGKAELIRKEAPDICYPKWTKQYYIGREGEYRRLERAIALCVKRALPVDYALRCASWGRFQILADNYKKAGFKSVIEFVDSMFLDEDNHLEAFVAFVENSFIDDDLRAHAWAVFARVYNGPGYMRNKYDIKLANAYAQFSRQKVDCQKLLAEAKKQEVSVLMPAVRYTYTLPEGFAHTSLDDRYTEENPFAGITSGEIDSSLSNSSAVVLPSSPSVAPPDTEQSSGIFPDDGEAAQPPSDQGLPLGDAADAEPKRWLEIEDLKPYVLGKLKGITKKWSALNLPQFPTLNGLSLKGLSEGWEWWWIPLVFSVLILIVSTLIAVGAAVVYGVILLWNRYENRKAREKVVDSIKDPNSFNMGLRVVKKFVGGKTECKEIQF